MTIALLAALLFPRPLSAETPAALAELTLAAGTMVHETAPMPSHAVVSELKPRLLRAGFPAQPQTITFHHVDTSREMAPAGPVLAEYGIKIEDVTPGSRLMIVNTMQSYEGAAFAPSTSQNALMQIDKGGPVSYTLRFSASIKELKLLRVQLLKGVTHPQWRAVALNGSGEPVGSVGERLLSSADPNYEKKLSAASFMLQGHDIQAVRVESNNFNFAAFGAVVLESITLDR